MSTLVEEMNRLFRNHVKVRPAKQTPKRKPGKSRKRLSMRPEKRPQTIMEQYRYREMMRQPHNARVESWRRMEAAINASGGTLTYNEWRMGHSPGSP
jgi:hypothetical protein